MHHRLACAHRLLPGGEHVLFARLEAAGAIAIGRSDTPEFCYRGTTHNELYGPTGNPSLRTARQAAAQEEPPAHWRSASATWRSAQTAVARSAFRPVLPAPSAEAVLGTVRARPDSAGWLGLAHFGPLTRTRPRLRTGAEIVAPVPRSPLPAGASALTTRPQLAIRAILFGPARRLLRRPRLHPPRPGGARSASPRRSRHFTATGATVEQSHPRLDSPLQVWNTSPAATAERGAAARDRARRRRSPGPDRGGPGSDSRALCERAQPRAGVSPARPRLSTRATTSSSPRPWSASPSRSVLGAHGARQGANR